MENRDFMTTAELAKMLGISRIAVFKKIKAGRIKASRVGRNYLIARKDLTEILGESLSKSEKDEIDGSVKKTVAEYGETLKLLGQE